MKLKWNCFIHSQNFFGSGQSSQSHLTVLGINLGFETGYPGNP